MANLKVDSPLARRIARSFLQFLNSVELSSGVDAEAIHVAKDCLSEVFSIDESSLDDQSSGDSLVRIFGSMGEISDGTDNVGFIDQPSSSLGHVAEEVLAAPQTSDMEMGKELHSSGFAAGDELFGSFFDALEKIHYFRRLPDGNDDQVQLDIATNSFHIAVKEMETAGCESFDQKTLAEAFKSQGNKAMQCKVYSEAVDLYTFAIALSENNAVYYCNRAAAFTQVQDYAKAVKDCLKSIEINPHYSKAYSRLGFAYYAQGKYRDAVDKGFRRALQLDPDNESVKENIRVSENKIKEEQRRAGTSQSSSSSGHQHGGGGGGSRSNTVGSNASASIPGLPIELSNLLNMAGNSFQGEPFQNGRGRGAGEDGSGVRLGGNTSLNELPAEISDTFRSMLRGQAFHGSQQQDDSTRRSN